MKVHHFPVQVYYEDTDHSGVIYHANYLKYFERAREDLIGIQVLIDLWKNRGFGFAVYQVEMSFLEGAEFGELLDIRTRVTLDGDYRTVWHQDAWRPTGKKAAVKAKIQMICLDRTKKLLQTKDVLDWPL